MATIIKNIGLLATPTGVIAQSGDAQGAIQLIPDTYIAVKDGVIEEVGKAGSSRDWQGGEADTVVDAQGLLVTPGLVDAHTHLLFAGWRQRELALKLQGMSYLDILAQGGGILHTVEKTRAASLEELLDQGMKSLDIMLAHGTTTCEVKSGYGLTTEAELKSLRAVRQLGRQHVVDVVPTFMGAHAIPVEYKGRSTEYVRLLCEEMIPLVAEERLAEFCDVFCETGVFTVEESREILECGKRCGLLPKIHAEEITALGGAELAGKVRATSAEHLIHADDNGLDAMAAANVIAVLLPGTSFYLGEAFARAKDMIDRGIAVAVASDFNPGSCPNESLQIPMNIACLKYRLTPEQVLTAATLNGAAAINRSGSTGSIELGKLGDIVIWNAPDLNFLFYHWGVNLVKTVVKRGKRVVG
ncbi:imidazolonepropionase [Anaerospora hongkongensis]|uniref:Imidazolonepropionase n=1 Tax=Anaerospora hongkongensis TaxID=244830 RepID=A0A4R1Q7W1_9FIRM|nr:imidazolonepropionase [Anaerospora hongkongensis]TCL37633.1 imidazolonepropionase [Anaerospora hongkongensis]